MAKKAQDVEVVEVVEAVEAKTAPAKAEKKTTRRTAPRAAKVKTTIALQLHGSELTEADLVEKAKRLWAEAGKTDAVKELDLYIKPEDNAVYCVVNGESVGSFQI